MFTLCLAIYYLSFTYKTSAIRVRSGFINIVKGKMLILLKVLKKYKTCTNVNRFIPDVLMECDFSSKEMCGLKVEEGLHFRIDYFNGNDKFVFKKNVKLYLYAIQNLCLFQNFIIFADRFYKHIANLYFIFSHLRQGDLVFYSY